MIFRSCCSFGDDKADFSYPAFTFSRGYDIRLRVCGLHVECGFVSDIVAMCGPPGVRWVVVWMEALPLQVIVENVNGSVYMGCIFTDFVLQAIP